MKRAILSLCILITVIAALVTSASVDTLNYELSPQDTAPEGHEYLPTADDSPYQPAYQKSDAEEVPSGEDSDIGDTEASQNLVVHRKFRECIWRCRYTSNIWTTFGPLKQCVVKCITIVSPRGGGRSPTF
ncbi:12681_t:CDS:1 [Dentiscutata erythropus]|uniref:12681_t:CDS:1 n=1 Tax=Dentiscutata erythropus TaxID=1348616 RepID=A0A9N9IU34_9GLOM|nr:12681_t:CDS:1 [Dentiscutata erythropus]